jgi:hypothetical protein
VGFVTTDQLSIEPAVSLVFAKPEDVDAIYELGFTLSGLYHFVPDVTRAQPYLRGQGQVVLAGSGGESVSQLGVGGGLGVKIPIVERLVFRLEGSYGHRFENDDLVGMDTVAGLFGFSFFTR